MTSQWTSIVIQISISLLRCLLCRREKEFLFLFQFLYYYCIILCETQIASCVWSLYYEEWNWKMVKFFFVSWEEVEERKKLKFCWEVEEFIEFLANFTWPRRFLHNLKYIYIIVDPFAVLLLVRLLKVSSKTAKKIE